MFKRIVCLAVLFLTVALPGWSREGFGFSKKTVEIDRTLPPAVNISGTRVKVFVNTEKSRKNDKAQALRDLTESAILAGNPQMQPAAPADINVSIVLDRLDVDSHNETRADTEEQKVKGKDGKSTYVKVPTTKDFTRVHAEIDGTYEITDAKGRVIDFGDVDRKFDKDYEYVTPKEEKLESSLLQFAADKIAARVVPTKQKAHLLLPKGSFEQFIPLAESGAWDRYLAGVESIRPLNDRASDAYRQYALGVAKEAVAYKESDPKKALELLRAAAVHYQTAAADNADEKLFSERLMSMFSAARSPVERVDESIKAYEAWASGPTPPKAAASASARSSKTLRNQQVIDMANAGLSDENIILAINSAESLDFDTTPEGLVALSKAGVSKSVIAHMQRQKMK